MDPQKPNLSVKGLLTTLNNARPLLENELKETLVLMLLIRSESEKFQSVDLNEPELAFIAWKATFVLEHYKVWAAYARQLVLKFDDTIDELQKGEPSEAKAQILLGTIKEEMNVLLEDLSSIELPRYEERTALEAQVGNLKKQIQELNKSAAVRGTITSTAFIVTSLVPIILSTLSIIAAPIVILAAVGGGVALASGFGMGFLTSFFSRTAREKRRKYAAARRILQAVTQLETKLAVETISLQQIQSAFESSIESEYHTYLGQKTETRCSALRNRLSRIANSLSEIQDMKLPMPLSKSQMAHMARFYKEQVETQYHTPVAFKANVQIKDQDQKVAGGLIDEDEDITLLDESVSITSAASVSAYNNVPAPPPPPPCGTAPRVAMQTPSKPKPCPPLRPSLKAALMDGANRMKERLEPPETSFETTSWKSFGSSKSANTVLSSSCPPQSRLKM